MDVLDFVIENGADINDPGQKRNFPVDLAIYSGNVYAAEKLLGLEAKFGASALENALDSGRKEYLVQKLLEKGADVNAENLKSVYILPAAAKYSYKP